jgi:hypothetical protein
MDRIWSIRWLGLALLVASLGSLSVPAVAQCALCGITPGDASAGQEAAPLEIELETTLDFDRIIIDGNGGGTVRLMPDGTSDSSGGVESVSGRVRIGRVVIHGEPGRAIHVDFPKSIELTGMQGTVIRVSALITNLPDSPTLDSSGQLAIDFGGELKVEGGVDGDFRGNLLVRADYL